MKTFKAPIFLSSVFFVQAVLAQSVFVPENGNYAYNLDSITKSFQEHGINYVELKAGAYKKSLLYKLDSRRNEYQIKNWFQQDRYLMQDMFAFAQEEYIHSMKAGSFNEAKRKQYSAFAFDKKNYYHYKTVPAMKEWGGLTHPPIKKLELPLEKYDVNFAPKNYASLSAPYFSPELQREIDIVSKSELSFGNTLVALADNAVFEKKKAMIRNARSSILMSSLVFVCEKSTKQIVDLLIQKHREGVDVKIMADGFISKFLKHRECLKTMSAAGIKVLETKDFFRHKLKAIYHTKTLVVDFNEAIAGGHNMIDADNLSRSVDFTNRDIDLHVKGPMVTDIAMQFVQNWEYQTTLSKDLLPLHHYKALLYSKLKDERKAGLRGHEKYAQVLGNSRTRMFGVCRFIKQAPYVDGFTIGKAYLKLLDKVERHLVITDPVKTDTFVGKMSDAALTDRFDSFVMFNLLHNKVQSLAKAGKKIDYITTNINMAGNENVAMMDARIKEQLEQGKNLRANWSLAKLFASNSYFGKPHYQNLMKDWLPFDSVHIWTHMSFMHSKVFYFDRIVASIGSLNFQHNATDQAYESTAICMDEKLNKGLDEILVEDMANSIPLIFYRLQ